MINSLTLSLLYGPTLTSIHNYWKTIALTIWTFVGKVMSLLFNIQSRLVIAFLLRSKCLLISWLQSPSAVILEPRKIKSATVSTSICHEGISLCRFVIKNSTFKKLRSWHRVHHFMANRWGNSGNSDRLYCLGGRLQNHCRW